jgi:fucose permease
MSSAVQAEHRQSDLHLVIIAYASFIALGMLGSVLGVLWSPHIQQSFNLELDAIGALLITNFIGYATASFLGGRLVARFGVGTVALTACALNVLALLGFAFAPSWEMIVLLGLVVSANGGALDTVMNILFAARFNARLMSWLHAAFGVGTFLGPLIATAIVTSGGRWQTTYTLIAGLYAGLAALFLFTRIQWTLPHTEADSQRTKVAPMRSTIRLPLVWFSVLMFFCYGGLEATPGQWSTPLYNQARGLDFATAGLWVSYYWASFTIGRILFGIVLDNRHVSLVIRACMAGCLAGAGLYWWNPTTTVSLIGLLMMGFCMSPMFALFVTDMQARLGIHHAPNAIGFQVAATSAGFSLLPALAGVLANNNSLETVPPFVLIVIIVMFGLYEMTRRAPSPEGKSENA